MIKCVMFCTRNSIWKLSVKKYWSTIVFNCDFTTSTRETRWIARSGRCRNLIWSEKPWASCWFHCVIYFSVQNRHPLQPNISPKFCCFQNWRFLCAQIFHNILQKYFLSSGAAPSRTMPDNFSKDSISCVRLLCGCEVCCRCCKP